MTTDAKPGSTLPLADILAAFSAADQAEIRAHADHLIQESRTVGRLRRDFGATWVRPRPNWRRRSSRKKLARAKTPSKAVSSARLGAR